VVMSVVAGLNFYIADHVANLGSNVYIVHRFGIITSYDAWIKAQKRPLITMAEYELLRDNMKTALQIAAVEDKPPTRGPVRSCWKAPPLSALLRTIWRSETSSWASDAC